MSCLLALGFTTAELDQRLARVLNDQAFLPMEQVSHEYASKLAVKAAALGLGTLWFIAADQDGAPDFDMAYDLPNTLKGRLGTVIESMKHTTSVNSVELFLYDLGSHDMRISESMPMNQMEETLCDLYEKGAPAGSVHHTFIRTSTT